METEIFGKDEMKDGEMKAVQIGIRSILICRINGSYYAIDNLCSHLKVPLAIGTLEGEVVSCRAHGAQFHVCTGKMLAGPANEKWQGESVFNKVAATIIPKLFAGDVPIIPVHIKNDRVFVELPD